MSRAGTRRRCSEATWEEFRAQGLLVIGVDTQDMEAPARAFLKAFHITYRTLRDPDGAVTRLFGTTGVPETFFIGRDGRIHGKFPGMEVKVAALMGAGYLLVLLGYSIRIFPDLRVRIVGKIRWRADTPRDLSLIA